MRLIVLNNNDRLDHEAKLKNAAYYWRAPPKDRKEEQEGIGIDLRDLFEDIPYVDYPSAINVDEQNDWIHIKPKQLRDGQSFEYGGKKYYIGVATNGVFSIW